MSLCAAGRAAGSGLESAQVHNMHINRKCMERR